VGVADTIIIIMEEFESMIIVIYRVLSRYRVPLRTPLRAWIYGKQPMYVHIVMQDACVIGAWTSPVDAAEHAKCFARACVVKYRCNSGKEPGRSHIRPVYDDTSGVLVNY
jgi:hypothetical protein